MKLIKLCVLSMAALMAVAAQAGIGVGDKAPAIKVAKWSKGKPFSKFEPGQIYVVEFWATWCGPCKTSIPHLTELAKKFKGKVNFTGVSVWETEPGKTDTTYFAKVDKFVKDMGAKMDYNVAIDGPEGTMADTWMKAAGQDGIPAAFVIDQKGTIAWIGHPMSELESVLDQVVAGKYDLNAAKAAADKEAKEREAAKAAQQGIAKDMGEVMELVQAGKGKEAIAKLEPLITKYPAFKNELLNIKFEMLLEHDEAAAYPFAKQCAENEWKDNPTMLNQVAWTIIEAKPPVKNPDLKIAVAIAQRAVELTKSQDPMILDTYAFGLFKTGEKAKAIELQTKAVELLKTRTDIPDDIKKEITDRLEMFKKG
ncbi:MAG TPA: redoxin domain-containing protein [Fimbriimonadaceae bacterium]|nr:redoxin domain-containing protein [Fimbriimonadaceae bacterium]